MDLTWTDNSNDEDTFEIERSEDGVSWSPIASLGADATSYSDGSVSGGMTYHYRVLLHKGDEKEAKIAAAFEKYAKEKK